MKNELSLSSRYIFWLNDPTILYSNGNYLKFIPLFDMTIVEQMNAITRFFIYYIIILLLFGKINVWMYIPVAGIIFIIIMYYVFESDPAGKKKELYRMNDINIEKMKNTDSNNTKLDVTGGVEYEIQSGFYDSDGNLQLGEQYDAKSKPRSDPGPGSINYGVNELLQYQKATCRKSNIENPFKNPPITDFNNGDHPVACNDDDSKMNDILINKNFDANLYRDIEDLYDVKNSQRQFYTVPVTSIPNNQKAFAEWCWGNTENCKVDQNKCLQYDSLRLVARET